MTEGWPSSIRSFDDISERFSSSERLLHSVTEAEPGRGIIALSRLPLDGQFGSGDTVRVDADDNGLILGALVHRGEQTVEAGV
ncbi:hypothetical protein AB0H49_11195 [Nocardia sp. NPDC050713]|uniref:hypothetical protein n=1 Tax=Nocardia sp. NPDC050713 TaxID=3154511 RepID=UPI003405280C